MEHPETTEDPVAETRHGDEVTDPYRWLEGDDEAVRDWIDEQNEHADQYLQTDTSPVLEERFEDLARVTDYGPVEPEGGRYFQEVEAADEEHPTLYVGSEPGATDRALVDPTDFEGETSMDWFSVAPGGDRVAYGIAEGGDEQYDVHVMDVETGEDEEVVPDTGRTNPFGLAWTDDGFYSVRTGGPGGGDQLEKSLWFHAFGDDPDEDDLVTDDFDEHAWVHLERDDDTGLLLVNVQYGTTHSELHRLDGDTLEPVLRAEDATFHPTVHGDGVYVQTDYEAPYGRVLRLDVDEVRSADGEFDPDEVEEVLPEDDGVLKQFAFAGDRMVVHRHVDAHSTLSVHEPDGSYVRDVPLPEYCSVLGLQGADDAPEAFYVVQTFTDPQAVTRYDLDADEATVLASPDVAVDADLAVDQEWFTSADGTEVPAFVVRRADLERDGENPTVLYGYGGFRNSLTPGFDRFRAPFLEHGGVFVVANLRGGTEFGEEWHRAGMLENKQNVFDDYLAVARGLCERDYTRPGKLAAMGGSNGGLLVGAAITQAPDQFGAALSAVPLLDMLRFHEFLLGESWTVEYGSPEDPEAYEYLKAYSPYHNVEQRDYPPTLFKTALGDTRVHPSHARKMTARLQTNNTADTPVLLRTETETGHGVGKSTSREVREQTETWTFLADQLGLDVRQ